MPPESVQSVCLRSQQKTPKAGSRRFQMGLVDDILPAIRTRYKDLDVGRVVEAWKRGIAGEVTTKDWEGRGSQVAASYINDLYTEPWHQVREYPWVKLLEENAAIIRQELRHVIDKNAGADSAWVAAAGDDAEAYGPGWSKLVLQERVWNSAVCALFPKTYKLVKDCGAPTVEVMFAKQRAESSIQPHTDNSNFFVTAHIGLEIPREKCWIRVGSERREWREDEAFVFDSSFVHETSNDAASDRIILLLRFWHPQLTEVEISALNFIFTALDDPAVLDEPVEAGPRAHGSNAKPSEVTADAPVSVTLDTQRRGSIAAEPLGAEGEAEKLDGFLADLKSQGLLPNASTADQALAQGPKNRNDRRKASKGKKKSSSPGKGKKR